MFSLSYGQLKYKELPASDKPNKYHKQLYTTFTKWKDIYYPNVANQVYAMNRNATAIFYRRNKTDSLSNVFNEKIQSINFEYSNRKRDSIKTILQLLSWNYGTNPNAENCYNKINDSLSLISEFCLFKSYYEQMFVNSDNSDLIKFDETFRNLERQAELARIGFFGMEVEYSKFYGNTNRGILVSTEPKYRELYELEKDALNSDKVLSSVPKTIYNKKILSEEEIMQQFFETQEHKNWIKQRNRLFNYYYDSWVKSEEEKTEKIEKKKSQIEELKKSQPVYCRAYYEVNDINQGYAINRITHPTLDYTCLMYSEKQQLEEEALKIYKEKRHPLKNVKIKVKEIKFGDLVTNPDGTKNPIGKGL